MTDKIKSTIEALERNNIKAYYAGNSDEAVKIVNDMLFKGAVITRGGSMSVKQSGVFDLLLGGDYRFLDRNKAGITPKEEFDTYKETVGADFYFCSCNAVTQKGELFNVDGFSNRISAIAFGPKKVIMIVGKNKIVPDLKAAVLRLKTVAAPKNCVRLNKNTPCATLGRCVSLLKNENPEFTDGCDSKGRICRNYLVSGPQGEYGRINVIIVDEDLGY